MAVPAVLREHGVEPESVLAEFGLGPDIYDDPDNTIPFATSCAILERGAELTRCLHFGLLVGQRAGLSMLGALGYLMQSSPDVRSALVAASRGFRTHNQSSVIDFSEDVSTAAFGYRILSPGLPGRHQVTAGAVAVAFNSLRALCGPGWYPHEVRFAQVAPTDVTPYRRFFQAPVVFNAGESSIVFASHWLDRPPPGADPILNMMMKERIDDVDSGTEHDLIAYLHRTLPSMILAGDAALNSVAPRVGLGARSLNRRLAAQGTSLRHLIEQARHTLARQLLQDTLLAASEIGERLGYANASAFTRAFKRWTGQGPAEWRGLKGRYQRPAPRTRGPTPSRTRHPGPGRD